MSCVEIVRLRCIASPPPRVLSQLRRSLAEHAPILRSRLLRRDGVDTDLAVLLLWLREPREPSQRQLGARLAEALSEHGLVEHGRWLDGWP